METKQQQTLTHKRKSEQAIGLTEADIVVIQKVLQVLTRPRADFRAAALCSQTSGAGLCVSSKLVTASGSPRERERGGGLEGAQRMWSRAYVVAKSSPAFAIAGNVTEEASKEILPGVWVGKGPIGGLLLVVQFDSVWCWCQGEAVSDFPVTCTLQHQFQHTHTHVHTHTHRATFAAQRNEPHAPARRCLR